MDKPLEKKEDKPIGKKNFDIKPMDKILKRYETLVTKEKDLFPERTKKVRNKRADYRRTNRRIQEKARKKY